ncbi:MAG: tRNA 2-thiouridine(34) synthase MnmA [Candidatus Taylorbacteria bacterium CG11_big_fil_rev_8_21_14_0_20_46_11]|uniref:tRNA-specific 2-thiouridylase MnmA n=1 Tax=Candidatus Taylorbacteria bacterium CG11_big_fil_rev_8_21_14_0_20_46_11 TaxID=1975025 RepID=A0A2H0KC35_9BACT|nr:MAG: tRNA 2-thiouridine(34) synthase MnmA [Candidatus Taylorbacteria bacterium CG11_big_fil_rev_8_21_14_0_20_46_11]
MCQGIPKKVFVGLSGGVDSSVSALLLKQKGFEVTGVFIKVWRPDFFECTWKDDRLDAMRICAKLDIPFVELDLEKEYKNEVVDYMIREYKAGKTPNPDVFCNRFIKFGGFYRFARKAGADFIATGHYARIVKRESYSAKRQKNKRASSLPIHDTRYTLQVGADSAKDQSYFLWQIKREQLPHILFPVGGMEKPEVRKLAKKFGLITAEKKDSQGLCFVGKVDMKEFLKHYITPKVGKILNEKGNAIGRHNGAFFYTIGERVGNTEATRNTEHGSNTEPLYVISKDIKKNTLTVSHKSPKGMLSGALSEVSIKNCNWIAKPIDGKVYQARTRYRQPLQNCHVANTDGRRYLLQFEKPQTVAPGQSLVLYDGDVCLGGGIM